MLEIRQQYAFYGVLLYVGATTFVLYMAIEEPSGNIWNGLFWVLQLFICINAVAKSFLQESAHRMLYYQSIVSARDFMLAKLFFNALLMLVMSSLSFAVYALFLGNPVVRLLPFLLMVLFGGLSLSLVFSFLAAIASRAQQNSAIMAILGFPVIIPQLVMLVKISAACFTPKAGIPFSALLLLAGIDLLVVLLSVILFPFLWKD